MRLAVLAAVLLVAVPVAGSEQTRQAPPRGQRPSTKPAPTAGGGVAEAYGQFLIAHRLEQNDDVPGAIAAYKRAMEFDPLAADVPAELAALYLRQNRVEEAVTVAEQALKLDAGNREANRVLGIVYTAISSPGREGARSAEATENLGKAIGYLEASLEQPSGESDPNIRATLARLYLRAGSYDKAIPILLELTAHEPGWPDGPPLLVQAYSSAGRDKEAVAWLEERTADEPRLLPTLGELYERDRRWADAADTYAKAVQRAPRNMELKTRYASVLMSAGRPGDMGSARDVLRELAAGRTADPRVLYLLSQAERRTGNLDAAEATARRLIAAQGGRSPWGYFALTGALEERRDYKAIVDALVPAIGILRQQADSTSELGMLLPHLGFAHEILGQHDQAIAVLEEARVLAPNDLAVTSYLIEANIGAKRFGSAAALAGDAFRANPANLRLASLQARALRQDGKAAQGISLLEDVVARRSDEPAAYVALAQAYSEDARWTQAVKVLRDAEGKFPADTSILFELGTVFDRQKNFAEAEATFRRVLTRESDNAAALNYLGYLLAERGERLDESVAYLKKALEKDPHNGSYLDSLGWAYFKAGKLDLAEPALQKAAAQLRANSVIQDHYGDLLFKMGRLDDAVAAWDLALAGDSESIDRASIDKKIRTARQKLGKK